MTPWFELVRHVRQHHDEMATRSREHQLVEHGRREPLRRAHLVVWWWLRPRDGTVYVLQDADRRLGVARG